MAKHCVLIMAGGTGGHVFPGLALAEELRRRNFQIEWLGTAKGIESTVVPNASIALHTLSIAGVRGRGIKALLLAPLKIMQTVFSAKRLIATLKPSLVVGFGGYASGPGGIAAKLSGLPLLIHEQNAVAGTTNKWLAKFANKVATAFPDVFPSGEFVGNPIRQELCGLAAAEKTSQQLNLLVLGGSRGAKAINELVPEAVSAFDAQAINVKHQCGRGHLSDTSKAYEKYFPGAEVVEFISDMKSAFQWADLVVSRSGASTVTELAEIGLPAIFIPFPHAIDDHQTENAKYLERAGAAHILQQKAITSKKLAELINQLLINPAVLQEMGKNAKAMAKPGATEKLADMCEALIRG